MKPKISFDFDGTLEYEDMQQLAKSLIDSGYQVCVLTTRYSDPSKYPWAKRDPVAAKHAHDELYSVCEEIGIKEVNFTEYRWKTTLIDTLGINIHIDDNYEDEVRVINGRNKARAILYTRKTRSETIGQVFKAISEFENLNS